MSRIGRVTQMSVDGERVLLRLRTTGILASVDKLLVRLESPVLRLTAVAHRSGPHQRVSGDHVEHSAPTDSLTMPSPMPSPRAFKFRPPTQTLEWDVALPSCHELLRDCGFAEGIFGVEVSGCVDKDHGNVFTSDGHVVSADQGEGEGEGVGGGECEGEGDGVGGGDCEGEGEGEGVGGGECEGEGEGEGEDEGVGGDECEGEDEGGGGCTPALKLERPQPMTTHSTVRTATRAYAALPLSLGR